MFFISVSIDVFKYLVCRMDENCLCVLPVICQFLGVPEDAVLCKKFSLVLLLLQVKTSLGEKAAMQHNPELLNL